MATTYNLVPNPVPLAVTGTTSWTGSGATLAKQPGYLQATLTTATATVGAQAATTAQVNAVGVPVVSAIGQARCTAAAGLALQITWLSSTGAVLKTTTGAVATSGSSAWVDLPAVTSTAPTNPRWFTVSVIHADTGARAVGDTIDFRRVGASATTTPQAYFDATFLPEVGAWYAWQGTAYASSSVRTTETPTGLPRVKVELGDGASRYSFPYDITAYVDLSEALSIKHGRSDQAASIEPSELTLRLNNRDGRFTIGDPTYGVYLDQPIRVTYYVDSIFLGYATRFVGYVQKWPVAWEGGPGALSTVTITATDEKPRWERRSMQPQFDFDLVKSLTAGDAYWPLDETPGALVGRTRYGTAPALTPRPDFPAPIFGAQMLTDDRPLVGVTSTGSMLTAAHDSAVNGTGLLYTIGAVIQTGITVQSIILERGVRTDSRLTVGIDANGRLTATWKPEGSTTTITATDTPVLADNVPVYVEVSLSCGASGASVRVSSSRSLNSGTTASTSTASPVTGSDPRQISLVGNATFSHVVFRRTSDVNGTAMLDFRNLIGNVVQTKAPDGVLDDALFQAASGAGTDASTSGGSQGRMVVPLFTPEQKLSDIVAMVEETEPAVVYVKGVGDIGYQGRTYRAKQPLAMVIPTDASDPGDVFEVQYDMEDVTNYRVGQRSPTSSTDDPATMVSSDDASIARHDRRESSGSTSLAVLTDQEVKDRLDWEVATSSEPRPRFPNITVDLLTCGPHYQVQFLQNVEVSARARVTGMPSQSPALPDFIVEGWTETVRSGDDAEFSVAFNLTSWSYYQAWRLEDPESGSLDGPARLQF